VIDALTRYGTAYGMVFQIVDDILDITSSDAELGKPAGHDMVEGVYTLPVLHTMAVGDAAGIELQSMLGAPLDDAQQRRALEIVRAGSGIRFAIETAQRFVQEASDACDELPQGEVTDALREATKNLLQSIA
jgi:heptaprenyl diphosphate synthase